MHYHPVLDGNAITIVSLLIVPLSFLAGIGTMDYWFYWAAGRPTRPEDHSGHGARNWRDYFRVNTDHKVIGIQYVVTSFFFLLVGGLLAMLIRVQLAKPGMQFLTPEQYNGVFSRPRDAADLPVRDPCLRGARELRAAADDRRARHGVPAAERAVVLDAAARRADDADELPGPRGLVRRRLDRLRAALDDDAPGPAVLHDRGPVSRAPRRSRRRSTSWSRSSRCARRE